MASWSTPTAEEEQNMPFFLVSYSLVHTKNPTYLQFLSFLSSPYSGFLPSALEKQVHNVREQRKQDSLFVCNIVIKSILFVLPLNSYMSFKNQFSYKLSNTVKAFASVDS